MNRKLVAGVGIGFVLSLVAGAGFLVGTNWQDVVPEPPTPTPAPTPIAVVSPAASVERTFEQLTPCEQLDSIAKSGGSVAQFVADSGLERYRGSVYNECGWHSSQIDLAERIVNPPVVTVPAPVVVQQSSFTPNSDADFDLPHWDDTQEIDPGFSRWNNCNGIQEPGETFSADCYEQQTGHRPDFGYNAN